MLFAEDRRLVLVVFKLKQIVGGIFKHKGQMLKPGAWKSLARFLVKVQTLSLSLICQSFPILLVREDQTEMTRIDPLLFFRGTLGEMRNDLMSLELQSNSGAGNASQLTA